MNRLIVTQEMLDDVAITENVVNTRVAMEIEERDSPDGTYPGNGFAKRAIQDGVAETQCPKCAQDVGERCVVFNCRVSLAKSDEYIIRLRGDVECDKCKRQSGACVVESMGDETTAKLRFDRYTRAFWVGQPSLGDR